MKRIILILSLALPSLIFSQVNSNIISKSDFNNILINGATFINIESTMGNQTQLNSILSSEISESEIILEENYFNYNYDGFEICFSNNEIAVFEITKSNWNITIKGKTVTIGSHKDVLGNTVLNSKKDGGKSIVYQFCNGCNNYLALDLNSNGIITKIIYIQQT